MVKLKKHETAGAEPKTCAVDDGEGREDEEGEEEEDEEEGGRRRRRRRWWWGSGRESKREGT